MKEIPHQIFPPDRPKVIVPTNRIPYAQVVVAQPLLPPRSFVPTRENNAEAADLTSPWSSARFGRSVSTRSSPTSAHGFVFTHSSQRMSPATPMQPCGPSNTPNGAANPRGQSVESWLEIFRRRVGVALDSFCQMSRHSVRRGHFSRGVGRELVVLTRRILCTGTRTKMVLWDRIDIAAQTLAKEVLRALGAHSNEYVALAIAFVVEVLMHWMDIPSHDNYEKMDREFAALFWGHIEDTVSDLTDGGRQASLYTRDVGLFLAYMECEAGIGVDQLEGFIRRGTQWDDENVRSWFDILQMILDVCGDNLVLRCQTDSELVLILARWRHRFNVINRTHTLASRARRVVRKITPSAPSVDTTKAQHVRESVEINWQQQKKARNQDRASMSAQSMDAHGGRGVKRNKTPTTLPITIFSSAEMPFESKLTEWNCNSENHNIHHSNGPSFSSSEFVAELKFPSGTGVSIEPQTFDRVQGESNAGNVEVCVHNADDVHYNPTGRGCLGSVLCAAHTLTGEAVHSEDRNHDGGVLAQQAEETNAGVVRVGARGDEGMNGTSAYATAWPAHSTGGEGQWCDSTDSGWGLPEVPQKRASTYGQSRRNKKLKRKARAHANPQNTASETAETAHDNATPNEQPVLTVTSVGINSKAESLDVEENNNEECTPLEKCQPEADSVDVIATEEEMPRDAEMEMITCADQVGDTVNEAPLPDHSHGTTQKQVTGKPRKQTKKEKKMAREAKAKSAAEERAKKKGKAKEQKTNEMLHVKEPLRCPPVLLPVYCLPLFRAAASLPTLTPLARSPCDCAACHNNAHAAGVYEYQDEAEKERVERAERKGQAALKQIFERLGF